MDYDQTLLKAVLLKGAVTLCVWVCGCRCVGVDVDVDVCVWVGVTL